MSNKTKEAHSFLMDKGIKSLSESVNVFTVEQYLDEYASIKSREDAIEFALWCGQNSTKYECDEDLWHHKSHVGHKYSSEIMYSLYLQSKKQQP